MVPNGKGRVESPFYKGQEEEAEGAERAIAFEKLRAEMLNKHGYVDTSLAHNLLAYDNLLLTTREMILIRGRI
jgi:hypothetical protein